MSEKNRDPQMLKITYLQPADDDVHRSQNGVTLLMFYTETNGGIFSGTKNNNIEPDDIQRWVSEEKIFKLKEPVFIRKDEILFIDYANLKVYAGDFQKENLKTIGIWKNIIE